MKEVHITIPSSTEFVGPVVNFFDALLVDTGLEKLAVSNVVTAVIEAVGNAIVHGNHSDKNKKVDIALKIHDNTLRLEVQDQGHGVNINELPDPLAPENLLKPCGRGIFLIKAFMDSIACNHDGNGSTFIMEKAFDIPIE